MGFQWESPTGADDKMALAPLDAPEKKEAILFLWLSLVERDLVRHAQDNKASLVAAQPALEKQLLKYISLTSTPTAASQPRPARPISNTIARIFVLLYTHGDTRTLFDTLSGLQSIFSAKGKKDEDINVKTAAIHCIGYITEHVGSRVLSLFGETAAIFFRLLKGARDSDVQLRFAVFRAFGRALKGAGKAASDAVLKDILKLGKYALADKSQVIRMAGAEILEMTFKHTPCPKPVKLDEFESYTYLVSKSFEGSTFQSRRAMSSFTGSILSYSQISKKILDKNAGKSSTPANTSNLADDQPLLPVNDMLNIILNQYLKSTTKDTKIGLIESYSALLHELGVPFIESNYGALVNHLVEWVSHPKLTATESDVLFIREMCSYILRDVMGKSLPEAAQINALRELVVNWLKKWSTGSKDVKSTPNALIFILNEVQALLHDLGSASAAVEENIYAYLSTMIGHSSVSVNGAIALTLRSLCEAQPKTLSKAIEDFVAVIQKDMNALQADKPDQLSRFWGYTYSLTAVIGVMQRKSLYISFESTASIFRISTQLLKTNAKDLKIVCIHLQVAWMLIGAIMSLGPNFVKVHLSQLLLTWKASFPKVTGKENLSSRSEIEWTLSLTSKDSALAALHSFLVHNSKDLLTIDVAKRIVVFLNNTLAYLQSIPSIYMPSASQNPTPALIAARKKLIELELSVKKRMLQCYSLIKPISSFEATYSLVIRMACQIFAPEPDNAIDRGLGVPVVDKYPPPIDLSILTSFVGEKIPESQETRTALSLLSLRETDVRRVENHTDLISIPTMENDMNAIFLSNTTDPNAANYCEKPDTFPTSVGAVDAAIHIFGLVFPLEKAELQEQILEELLKIMKYSGAKLNAGRKLSLQINSIIAVSRALKTVGQKSGSLASERVPTAIQELVQSTLISSNTRLRILSSEMLGLLSKVVSSGQFLNQLLQYLVNQVVNNREPDARAGSALALGCIHNYSGGLVIGSHLKTTVGILHSLSTDSHPLVHTYALYSLWLTIESAGLMYGPFVNSTLSLLTKLIMSDSHQITHVAGNEPLENNSEVMPTCGKILHALIGVVGPEMQSSTGIRDICFALFEEFKFDSDAFVVAEAVKCIQQFILFASKYVDVPNLIPFLQSQLAGESSNQVLFMRKAAITCFYQLTQRDPNLVLTAASNRQLEEQLFSLLDVEMESAVLDETKDIIVRLLCHVAPDTPSRWIDLCKNILAKGGSTSSANAAAEAVNAVAARNEDEDDEDDEDGGQKPKPAAKPQKDTPKETKIVLLPRWRTQTFALTCLRKVITVSLATGKATHSNLALAKSAKELNPEQPHDYLVFRLADLIRMAFNSATFFVPEMRLEGLYLLQDLLEKFALIPDPDFEGHALLEQYQAQISAALTPAFSEDSPAEIMSLACRVTASYIGSGINKDLSTLSRVLKLLLNTLEICKDDESMSTLCYHEKVMLKLATVTAWADLCIAGVTHSYLKSVVVPHLKVLEKLWISVLRDYAKAKIDIDLLSAMSLGPRDTSSGQNSNSEMYVEATREVLKPFYKRGWLSIFQALALLMGGAAYEYNFESFKDKSFEKTSITLLGLCIEAISNGGLPVEKNDPVKTTLAMSSCLESLKQLLRPTILPSSSLPKAIFIEIVNVLDRLLQTEDLTIQIKVAETACSIISNYGDELLLDDVKAEQDIKSSMASLSLANPDDVNLEFLPPNSRIYNIMKLVLNIFMYFIPSLSNNPTSTVLAHRPVTPQTIQLLSVAVDSLILFSNCKNISAQYLSCIFPMTLYIYLVVLESGRYGDIAPKFLACLKHFADLSEQIADDGERGPLSLAIQSGISSLIDSLYQEVYQDGDDFISTKNSILAIILIVTSAPSLSHHHDNQQRIFEFLLDSLHSDSIQYVQLALQCIRSLLVLTTKEPKVASSIGSSYIRVLVPHVAAYFLKLKSLASLSTAELANADDTIKILLSLCSFHPGYTSSIITFFIQTLSPDNSVFYKLISQSLLQLATFQSAVFKQTISQLSETERITLETALKAAMSLNSDTSKTASASSAASRNSVGTSNASNNVGGSEVAAAPKIQLKFFGQ